MLRRRPLLPIAAPLLVMPEIEVGGWSYPPGVGLVPFFFNDTATTEIYPEPYAFRPERFLGQKPGTYTWIPFGGGRRRCIGAAFAELEMKLVLEALLARCELAPAGERPAVSRRRGIALSPSTAGVAVLP